VSVFKKNRFFGWIALILLLSLPIIHGLIIGCENTGKGRMIDSAVAYPSVLLAAAVIDQSGDRMLLEYGEHDVNILFYTATGDKLKCPGIVVHAAVVQKYIVPDYPNRWDTGGQLVNGITGKDGKACVKAIQTDWEGDQWTNAVVRLYNPASPNMSQYWSVNYVDRDPSSWTHISDIQISINGMTSNPNTNSNSNLLWPQSTQELPFSVSQMLVVPDPNDPNLIANITTPQFQWGLWDDPDGFYLGEPLLYPVIWKDYETHDPTLMAEPLDPNHLLLPDPVVCRITVEILDPALMPPLGAESTLTLESLAPYSNDPLIAVPIRATVIAVTGNVVTVQTRKFVPILWWEHTRWLWTCGTVGERVYLSVLHNGRYRISLPAGGPVWVVNSWLSVIGDGNYELCVDTNVDGMINYFDL